MKMELRPQQDYSGSRHPYEVFLEKEALLAEYQQDPARCWGEFNALIQGFGAAARAGGEPWRQEELDLIIRQLQERPQCPGLILAPLGEQRACLTYEFA